MEQSKMNGVVYMAKCLVNGKLYIGQTIQKFEKRKSRHLSDSRFGKTFFQLAIKKYGKQSFQWSILFDGIETQDELNLAEEWSIWNYMTIAPNGYNLATGGANGALHESTKKKMSEVMKNKHASMTDEQKMIKSEKARANIKAVWSNEELRKSRQLSMRSRVKKLTKAKATKIFNNINSEIKKAHRIKKRELEEMRIQSNPMSLEIRRRNIAGKRKVLCVETGAIYESAYEASEKTGIKRENIAQVCSPNSYKQTAGGYHWEYAS